MNTRKMAAIQMGRYIYLARTKVGLSQEALGLTIGVTGACVSRWESGNYFPRSHQIPPLAAALQIPVDTFQTEMETILHLNSEEDPTALLARGLARFLANSPQRINRVKARALMQMVGQVSEVISRIR